MLWKAVQENLLHTFYQMLGIIFFALMGVLHLLDFSDGTSVTDNEGDMDL